MKNVLSAGLCIIIAGVILAGCGGNIPTQGAVENEASEVVGTPEDFETLVTTVALVNVENEEDSDNTPSEGLIVSNVEEQSNEVDENEQEKSTLASDDNNQSQIEESDNNSSKIKSEVFEIDMTDDEINALAIQRADELQKLFLDFLRLDQWNLPFTFDMQGEHLIAILTDEKGNEFLQGGFFSVVHNEIKTYEDLFSLFTTICTQELSSSLLKKDGSYYVNIDGKLALGETVLSYPYSKGSQTEYVSYEILDDEIKLNFIAHIIAPVEDAPEEKREYSIIIKNINGEWLISGLSGIDALLNHGYFWNEYS